MQPIIVEGVPRSGTRFLCRYIETQFNIKIFRVQTIILKYYKLIYKNGIKDTDIRLMLSDMVNGYIFKNRVGIIDLNELQLEKHVDNFPQVLDAIFSNQAMKNGYRGWGLKFDNPSGMKACIDMFPESKFLHIIRDGRDTHLSSCKTLDAGYHNPYHNAYLWKSLIEERRLLSKSISNDRYFEFFYENLLSDPEKVFEELKRYLNIPDADYVNMGIKSANFNKWLNKMKDKDVYLYECIAGDLLSTLDYERKFKCNKNISQYQKYFYTIYEPFVTLSNYFRLYINPSKRHQVTHKLKSKISRIKSKY